MRRAGRELALQALYAVELNTSDTGRATLRLFWDNNKAPEGVRLFAAALVDGVLEFREPIDAKIKEKSKNWALSRMAKVDIHILRIAVYELYHRDDIPKVVTINEAIEVAKTFGNEESPAFVNGILDEISGELPEK